MKQSKSQIKINMKTKTEFPSSKLKRNQKRNAVSRFAVLFILTIITLTAFGCERPQTPTAPKITPPPQAEREERLPWVENSLTQPLPANASKTRLSLPAKIEDLMPDNAPITGFGAHIGQHVEGMDHVWVAVKKGLPAQSLADGKVMFIEKIGNPEERVEYMIYLDYGDGLACSYAEITKPLVQEGQTVKHLDPIGETSEFHNFEANEVEIYCADANRHDGITPTAGGNLQGTAVSPFDYLNETDKALLEETYQEKVINSYLAGKNYGESWFPSDPYLTNQTMIHQENKIVGEWFLINKKWNDLDLSLIIFLESNSKYYEENAVLMRVENANLYASKYIDGTYEVTYEGNRAKIVFYDQKSRQTYYALAEITESAGRDTTGESRAQMKFEWGQSPINDFSDQALLYQERGIYNPRHDAWKLGNWTNYQ